MFIVLQEQKDFISKEKREFGLVLYKRIKLYWQTGAIVSDKCLATYLGRLTQGVQCIFMSRHRLRITDICGYKLPTTHKLNFSCSVPFYISSKTLSKFARSTEGKWKK